SALAGSTPCQPRNGLIPANSRGRNIISMATRLVTYPISAAMKGMVTYTCQCVPKSTRARYRPGTGAAGSDAPGSPGAGCPQWSPLVNGGQAAMRHGGFPNE